MLSNTSRRFCYLLLIVACACAITSILSDYWIRGQFLGYPDHQPQFQAGLWKYESCPPLHPNATTGCEIDNFRRSICVNYSGECFFHDLQAVQACAVMAGVGGGVNVLVMIGGKLTGVRVMFAVMICGAISGNTTVFLLSLPPHSYAYVFAGLFGMIGTAIFVSRLGNGSSFLRHESYLYPLYIFILSWCLEYVAFFYFVFRLCDCRAKLSKDQPLLSG
jgi:hypothetical protein